MPSDDRIAQALEDLSDAKESFSSSVAMSAEEVRGILEREQGANENPQVRLAHELGPFAAGRIDLDRLAPFVGANEKLDEDKRAEILAAYQALLDSEEGRGRDLHRQGSPGRIFPGDRIHCSWKSRKRFRCRPVCRVGSS